MAIYYCDWATGDDSTGDGSAGNPYKTIDKATTGLTGGGECRCMKSPAHTALTGTLSFTYNSTAVTGSSTLFSSELSAGDYIKDGNGDWFEVLSIASDTSLTLYKSYYNTTEAGVSSYNQGYTSTGAAAAGSTTIQIVNSYGASTSSRVKISGGWNSSGVQDGETWFRQEHGTQTTRYGRGLSTNSKDYLEISDINFCRYDINFYTYRSDYSYFHDINTLAAGDESFWVYDTENSVFESINSSQNDREGMYFNSTVYDNEITDCITNSCSTGIYLGTGSGGCAIDGHTAKICQSRGIQINERITIDTATIANCGIGVYVGGNGCVIDNVDIVDSVTASVNIQSACCNTFNNCSIDGSGSELYLYRCFYNIFNNLTSTDCDYVVVCDRSFSNTMNNLTASGSVYSDVLVKQDYPSETLVPAISIQHFNSAGDNRQYFEYGVISRNTTDQRTGSQCIEFDPSDSTSYIGQSFFFPCDSGVQKTVSAYVDSGASFSGDFEAALYFLGEKITGWSAWTPTSTYAQKSIIAASSDITEDGVLELRIRARGDTVWLDDLAVA